MLFRYMKLKYGSIAEATAAIEELKTAKEGLTVRHYASADPDGQLKFINLIKNRVSFKMMKF